MSWQYEREEQKFNIVPEGAHRIRVKSAEKAVSKNGNDMLVLQFEVSGYTSLLFHYIVFLDDRPEITNRMLTQFFDAFPTIPEGDFNMNNWVGKVGACIVKHEEYQGQASAKIRYFLRKEKQDGLPPWKEPNGLTTDKDGYIEAPSDLDIPFD